MSLLKRLMVAATTAAAVTALTLVSASACTMIYAGSDLTADGGTYFARSEDIMNSYNKVFYVSPAGNHKAGDAYEGCYGFSYTFTHDSYEYTAFRDDNLSGVCPDCGESHDHTPYEAAGTNEMGVTVTATVTLGANEAMSAADPKPDEGIEEAEITTVLLSEAKTAREGLEILMDIYDSVGASGGSGIIIADQTETWYIENCSGTQYVAMKLPSDMVFVSPNMCAIGEIDLDDENIIASDALIETAVKAGTFVGDAEENVIDYRASYARLSVNSRMIDGINYLNSGYKYTSETITDDDFTISNVKDGKIVGLYTNITPDRTLTTKDLVDFYKVSGIGNASNLEYHLFQIYPEGTPETATVEWVGMDHGAYGVMVPYYPMLTTDVYEGYKVGTDSAAYVTDVPESGVYYPTTRRGVACYRVLPEGWEKSYYWCFDAVSNYLISVDGSQEQLVLDTYADLQSDIYDGFAQMQKAAAETKDLDKLSAIVTDASADMAKDAHQTALELYSMISSIGEVTPVVFLADETLGSVVLPDGFTFKGDPDKAPAFKEEVLWEGGKTLTVETLVIEDVTTEDWYAEPALFGVCSGLFNGTDSSEGKLTFAPDTSLNRGMFVTLLYRLAGEPQVTGETSFTDLTADYYKNAVLWAEQNEIVKGVTNTTFAPDDEITREQMVAMLYRFAGALELELETDGKPDASAAVDWTTVQDYAKAPMAWAVDLGIVNGVGTDKLVLDPTSTANRAAAAAVLQRFCEMIFA